MFEGRPIVRFVSKVATQSATAALATLIGGYILTALNLRNTEPARETSKPTVADERALTREYVKSLRESRDGRDDIAEVIRATPAAAPPPQPEHETIVAKTTSDAALGEPAAAGRSGPVRKENRLNTDLSAAFPAAAPPVAAPPLGEPLVLAPSAVAEATYDQRDQRTVQPQKAESTGVGTVFSTLSTALGSAANATGDTINFMIDLPARALGRRPEASDATPVSPARAPVTTSAPPLRFAGS